MPIDKLKSGVIKLMLAGAVFIVVFSFNRSEIANAQGGGTYNQTGGSQAAVCRGDRDFASAGLTLWNEFMDPADFYEYWKDITVRYWNNLCHYETVYSLIKRIDKARTQIRKAFYDCAMNDNLKLTYKKLEAELYFVRNYVDYVPASGQNQGKRWKEIKPVDDNWYSFTSNIFATTAEQKQFYNVLNGTYTKELTAYEQCTDPGIETLITRFKQDINYLQDTVAQSGKMISKRANRLAETSSNLWNSVKTGEYFANMVEVRLNGMACPFLGYLTASSKTEEQQNKKEEKKQECLIAAEQLIMRLRQNAIVSPTFYDFQQAADKIRSEADRIRKDTDDLARYEFMYKESSDNMLDQVKGRLDGLNNIITSTYDFQNKTINCVKQVSKSQCANIFGAGAQY